MKGLKIWAMLGGFAVASSCFSTGALANDAAKTGGATHPAKFNEMSAGSTSRGIRLDELFDVLRKEKAAPAAVEPTHHQAAIAPKATAKPVVHASKAAPKKTVIATQKAVTAKKPVSGIQTAEYKPNGKNNMLAVSSGGSSLQTPIISAWLDKPGTLPKYKAGDRMVVKLAAAADCNVLVFDYDSNGTLTQLFPNEFETNGMLKAGQQIEIGGSESKYTLDIGGKGIERIFVYAYPTSEQPITVAMSPIPHTPFRSVEISPDQYKKLVANSRTYFETSHDRSVKVTAKTGAQPVSTGTVEPDKQPNKLELTFQVDNK